MTTVGLILAGGRGRRMGADKGSLEFRGAPMAEHVRRALAAVCDEVWLSLRHDQDPPLLGVRAVRDPGEGPLGGLVAGLEAAPPGTLVVAVACDMPLVSPSCLQTLMRAVAGHDSALPVCGGVDQVACAVWAAHLAPTARRLFDAGGRALRDLLAGADVNRVPAERFHEELRSFDAPADLDGGVGEPCPSGPDQKEPPPRRPKYA